MSDAVPPDEPAKPQRPGGAEPRRAGTAGADPVTARSAGAAGPDAGAARSAASESAAVPPTEAAALAADVVSHVGTSAASPGVAPASSVTGLPGAHRGGFARLPTAPIDLTTPWAPHDRDAEADAAPQWLVPEPAPRRRGLAAWALTASIAGLLVSLFVGWGFPIGIVGIVAAIVALRSPRESRGVAVWALALGILSLVYSAGWLLFAATRLALLG